MTFLPEKIGNSGVGTFDGGLVGVENPRAPEHLATAAFDLVNHDLLTVEAGVEIIKEIRRRDRLRLFHSSR